MTVAAFSPSASTANTSGVQHRSRSPRLPRLGRSGVDSRSIPPPFGSHRRWKRSGARGGAAKRQRRSSRTVIEPANNDGGRAMYYREQLPGGCPPDTAEEITTTRQFYRFVRNDPPTDDDFTSLRARNSFRPPYEEARTECRARGLSVFSSREDADQKRKLPSLKGQLLCTVQLGPGAGPIESNGSRPHFTWWRVANFDVLPRCQVEAP